MIVLGGVSPLNVDNCDVVMEQSFLKASGEDSPERLCPSPTLCPSSPLWPSHVSDRKLRFTAWGVGVGGWGSWGDGG